MEEYIICSAIHFDSEKKHVHQPKNIEHGLVICGRRHHNCFATFAAFHNSPEELLKYKITQGFLTNTDRFVDRKEALEIALKAGQTTKKNGSILISEDIY